MTNPQWGPGPSPQGPGSQPSPPPQQAPRPPQAPSYAGTGPTSGPGMQPGAGGGTAPGMEQGLGPDPTVLATLGRLVKWLMILLGVVVALRLTAQTIRLVALLTSSVSSDAALLASGGGMLIALVISVLGLVAVLVLVGLAIWAAVLAEGKGRIGAAIMAVTPFAWWVLDIIVSVIVAALTGLLEASAITNAGASLLSPVLTIGFAVIMYLGWNMLRTWHRENDPNTATAR